MTAFEEWLWDQKDKAFDTWKTWIEQQYEFIISWDIIRYQESDSYYLDKFAINPTKFVQGEPTNFNVIVIMKWEYLEELKRTSTDVAWYDHRFIRNRFFTDVPIEDLVTFFSASSQGESLLAGKLGYYSDQDVKFAEGGPTPKQITSVWFKINFRDLDLPSEVIAILEQEFLLRDQTVPEQLDEDEFDESQDPIGAMDLVDPLEERPPDPTDVPTDKEINDDYCRERWSEFFKWKQYNDNTPNIEYPKFSELVSCSNINRDANWYHRKWPNQPFIKEEFTETDPITNADDRKIICKDMWILHLEWIENNVKIDNSLLTEETSPYYNVIQTCISHGADKEWFRLTFPGIYQRFYGVLDEEI